MFRRLESLHLPLPSSGCLVRILCTVICITTYVVFCIGQHIPDGSRITFETIGDNDSRRPALAFKYFPKEPLSCNPVTTPLHQDVQNIAVLVDCALKINMFAIDLDEHLVTEPPIRALNFTPFQGSLIARQTSGTSSVKIRMRPIRRAAPIGLQRRESSAKTGGIAKRLC